MSSSFNDKNCNKSLGKIFTFKALHAPRKNETGDHRRGTSNLLTKIPVDCQNIIFKCLETKEDRDAFCLTCHHWLHIHDNNQESLWYKHGYGSRKYPKMSPGIFPMVLSKLLIRFQHLKRLSLNGRPKITDLVASKSKFFGSEVQFLRFDDCFGYTDVELSLIFSWFPRLTFISLKFARITDKGLEALAKCCPSLETVKLSWCHSITDSGLSLLSQNCRQLQSLDVESCSEITRY
ncbi:hypothetical protein MKW94_029061 [Papaver nudicaule]|uniref:F-box/LRR-repeat protein 15-like leucin rich repeat domain-containing protein n=1 Tax=Papaver nudicaule TaxID=74823 RepID=A0AA41V8J2_PAPNU|nr:hypothetical protein [Papaver nudicaule]